MEFIDLYAGVGGFRLGFERKGHECVWSCENDKWCRQVYRYHWGEPKAGDVREVRGEEVPDHDLLCAGFPCQSFSLAGERKGFEDTRGTLFHEIGRIARAKAPEYLLLENVKGLLSTQDRQAFRVVLESLDGLGYNASWQVLNSKNFGVPQNRPRVFIVGHLREVGGSPWEILPVAGGEEASGAKSRGQTPDTRSGAITRRYWKLGNADTYIREKRGRRGVIEYRGRKSQKPKLKRETPSLRSESHGHQPKVIQKSPDWREGKSLREFAGESPAIRKEMGDNLPMILHNIYGGFGEEEPREFTEESPAIRTPKGGGHIPSVANAVDPNGYLRGTSHHDAPLNQYRIRKLTPVECERLQGFPDGWTKYGINDDGERVEISDTQRYKMMGNAVTVNVVEFLAERFAEVERGG